MLARCFQGVMVDQRVSSKRIAMFKNQIFNNKIFKKINTCVYSYFWFYDLYSYLIYTIYLYYLLSIYTLIYSTVQEFLDSPLQLSPPPSAISPADVCYIIDHLPLRKAPGFDLVTAEVLRQLPRKAIVFPFYLYNFIFRTTYFPILWKFSTIKLLHNPNKPQTEPSSYRPISLLTLFLKIFEKLLLKRLLPILDSQEIIPHH
jgi:hypothetical protein